MGETVNRALRSREGHYNIAEKVAVLEDGQVGWITGSIGSFNRFAPREYDPFVRSDTLFFLDSLMQQGVPLLDDLCFSVSGDPEQRLIDRFITSGVIKGEFIRNVHLKTGKQIDLICKTSEGTWIFEAKMQLNWEAFGQVIRYTFLYSVEHPDEKIENGIISASGDEVIEWPCQQMCIKFF